MTAIAKRLHNMLHGAGTVFNLWPDNRDRYKRIHPYRSDAEALRRDWERVGGDLWKAFDKESHDQTEK